VQINNLYGDPNGTGTVADTAKARREFFVDVRVERADLPLPCSIKVYLGSYLAGQISLLSMPRTGYAYDELPLSRAIRRLGVDNNDLRAVKMSLMDSLHVDVVKVRNSRFWALFALIG
jgi:tyrosinase